MAEVVREGETAKAPLQRYPPFCGPNTRGHTQHIQTPLQHSLGRAADQTQVLGGVDGTRKSAGRPTVTIATVVNAHLEGSGTNLFRKKSNDYPSLIIPSVKSWKNIGKAITQKALKR